MILIKRLWGISVLLFWLPFGLLCFDEWSAALKRVVTAKSL